MEEYLNYIEINDEGLSLCGREDGIICKDCVLCTDHEMDDAYCPKYMIEAIKAFRNNA